MTTLYVYMRRKNKMEIKEFEEKLKSCKNMIMHSNNFIGKVLKDKNKHTISFEKKCNQCHHKENKSVVVYFKKPHQMTIFEAGLLFYVWGHNKKPLDYTGYHKCPAGKEFIENIEKID